MHSYLGCDRIVLGLAADLDSQCNCRLRVYPLSALSLLSDQANYVPFGKWLEFHLG